MTNKSRQRGLASDVRVWLSIGMQEGDEAIADTRRLRDVIVAMRRGNRSRLRYVEYSGGTHSEDAWRDQLRDALDATASRRPAL